MTVDTTYPHVEKPAGEPARIKRFPRFRVSLLVSGHLAFGWSAEELCRQYPELKASEVYSALAYYYDHIDEIDAEIQTELDQLRDEAPRPSPFVVRMRAQAADQRSTR